MVTSFKYRAWLALALASALSFSACKTGEAAPSPSPAPSPQISPAATGDASYKPSQELFDSTFAAIKKLIDDLNTLIQARNYSAWLEMLSPEYRTYFSKPEVLAQQNDSKFLQSRGVTIKSLEDYFLNVVAPSRTTIHLDDLLFLNEREVEAIMQVGNRRVTVYSLIKIDGKWKIGLSKSGQ